jgi:hypothetical protein
MSKGRGIFPLFLATTFGIVNGEFEPPASSVTVSKAFDLQ